MSRLYSDMETIGFLPAMKSRKDAHCICAIDMDSGGQYVFYDEDRVKKQDLVVWEANGVHKTGDLSHGIQCIQDNETMFHNGHGFDFIAMESAFPQFKGRDYFKRKPKGLVPFQDIDTIVMSRTMNPERRPPKEAYQLGVNPGGHTIEAHGCRIGRYKVPNEDWTCLTDNMLTRCIEDCGIGADLFHYLLKEWRGYLGQPNALNGMNIVDAYEVEARVAMAMARQAKRGFPLDMKESWSMWKKLRTLADETERAFRPHMKKRMIKKPVDPLALRKDAEMMSSAMADLSVSCKGVTIPSGTHRSKYQTIWELLKKNGEYKKAIRKFVPKAVGFIRDHADPPVSGPFTPIEFEEIPLGNHELVRTMMYEHGWRGVNYSKADQIKIDQGEELPFYAGKVDEESIKAWETRDGSVPEWCRGITEWYIIASRMSVILNRKDFDYLIANKAWPAKGAKGLLAKAFNSETGELGSEYLLKHRRWPTGTGWHVPAIAMSNATNTHRMTHKVVVNIPRKGLHPLRHLFIASPGKSLLICDGSNLEIRILLHYMNDPDYMQIALNEDVHNYHINMTDGLISTRDVIKTFFYALLYGSGVKNLSNVCGLTVPVMKSVMDAFMNNMPALKELQRSLEIVAKKYKYIVAVDGRHACIRSGSAGRLLLHTVLNTTLQSGGSIAMKHGFCIAEQELVKREIALDESGYPGWIEFTHDEFGMQVVTKEVKEYIYEIDAEKEIWDKEEKRVHLDSKSRIWSAPAIVEKTKSKYTLRRRFHMAGHIIADSMRLAGERLKLRCPLEGEYKVGQNWWECH